MEHVCLAFLVVVAGGSALGVTFMVTASLKDSPVKRLATDALTLLACALYVFSPIDLAPEAVLGPFGLVDDLAAGLLAFRTARRMTRGKGDSEANGTEGKNP